MTNNLTLIILSLITSVILSGCVAVAAGGATAAGVGMLHDRRTSGAYLKDEGIEMKASMKLGEHVDITEQAHVNITSYNGAVLLTGEAPSEELRDKIVSVVRIVPGVKVVYSEIVVAEPSSLTTRSHDSLITSKVKTSLIGIRDIPGFDATRVKVVTENGTVYLMGLVSKKEADAVVEKARWVSGVKRVAKVFEYID
ncbi:MAG: BON domain-containing protein [Pseudomonadota bacterium]